MTVTDWFIIFHLVLLGAWDVVAMQTGWFPTISESVRKWGGVSTATPFLLVILFAFLFFHLYMWDGRGHK